MAVRFGRFRNPRVWTDQRRSAKAREDRIQPLGAPGVLGQKLPTQLGKKMLQECNRAQNPDDFVR